MNNKWVLYNPTLSPISNIWNSNDKKKLIEPGESIELEEKKARELKERYPFLINCTNWPKVPYDFHSDIAPEIQEFEEKTNSELRRKKIEQAMNNVFKENTQTSEELRDNMLLKFYELSNGDVQNLILRADSFRLLGLGENKAENLYQYLVEKGFLKTKTIIHSSITSYGIDYVENKKQNEKSIQKIIDDRNRFLQKFHNALDEDLYKIVYPRELGKNLGYDEQKSYKIANYFLDRGILKAKEFGGPNGVGYTITTEGLDYVSMRLNNEERQKQKKYDFFICHASEDKNSFVNDLADALKKKNYLVWYDDFTLTLGDSLRRKIDEGLQLSLFGIVILSKDFFKKEWAKKELDGLFAKEENEGKVILPIWHAITREEVARFSLLLADKMAVSTSKGLNYVVGEIEKAYKKNNIFSSKS